MTEDECDDAHHDNESEGAICKPASVLAPDVPQRHDVPGPNCLPCRVAESPGICKAFQGALA